jgi:tetratricopeptide (TPR) repeat protein
VRALLFVLFSFSSIAFSSVALAQPEARLESLRAAARAAPRDYAAQVALGRAFLEMGRYRDAEGQMRRAANLRRNDPAAMYEVARVYFEMREHQRARAQCRAIARVAQGQAIVHTCQARAFLAWARSARAFDELDAALAIAPNDFEALLALGEAHRLRAAVSESEAAYRRAITADATSAEPHLGLGQLYANANRRDEALASLRRAHELAPDDVDVDYELGRLLSDDQGLAHLRDAAAGRPRWAIVHAELGEALLRRDQHADAAASFRTAIGLDTNLASARSGLGRAQLASGDTAGAEATLRAAIAQVPNDALAVMALADVMAQTNRIEDAYEQYRHASDLDPSSPEPHVRAARLAMQQQRPVLAHGFLQRAIAIRANHAVALAMMGDVMRGRRDNNAARDFYQRALRGEGEIDRAGVERALRELR